MADEGTVFDGRSLRVAAVSAEVVLAMKVRAARPTDVDDIRFLLAHLGLDHIDDVVAVHDRAFPGDPLPEPKRMVVEDLLAEG